MTNSTTTPRYTAKKMKGAKVARFENGLQRGHFTPKGWAVYDTVFGEFVIIDTDPAKAFTAYANKSTVDLIVDDFNCNGVNEMSEGIRFVRRVSLDN